jgi:hypothetical protein
MSLSCLYHESASVVQYLLDLDLDATTLNAVDSAGDTALHYAYRGAKYETISLLLDDKYAAASASKRSAHEKLPFDLLLERDGVDDRESIGVFRFRLLKAYPETIMNYNIKQQAKNLTTEMKRARMQIKAHLVAANAKAMRSGRNSSGSSFLAYIHHTFKYSFKKFVSFTLERARESCFYTFSVVLCCITACLLVPIVRDRFCHGSSVKERKKERKKDEAFSSSSFLIFQ